MRAMFRTEDYLDLNQFAFPELFDGCENVWDALKKITVFLNGKEVLTGKGTVIEKGATIRGPAIIGKNCEIRANAYIRENVIVGDDCVLGNACEFKNAVLFNGCQVPHFNYVGDSILGHKAHLGAGVILSNFKSLKGNVRVEGTDTGLRKFGAVIGDGADIGCNCVLNPGSIIGRRAVLYPNVLWRGVCLADSIVKLRQQQEIISARESRR
jgi:UDP-N-acetylglucosamine diphosphorylase / glucose-1-phosphate thymidylyltransferase / UDP-N-acetylgalactosamine diphosphorylase / glucosamine-1-phosphate N-acetyltransferase / galactosamine-1-phosphate N-acetyltransferase